MKSPCSRNWLLSILLTISACQPTAMTPEALIAYVDNPDHGLRQQQQIKETQVTVSYQPTELFVAREVQVTGKKQIAVDSLRRQYAGATYFLLGFSQNGRDVLQPAEGFTRYSELLQKLAFHMPDYVRLVTSEGDTLRPVNYYLDRTGASAGAAQVLLAFPKLATTGTWQLQLQEYGLGTGDLMFSFDTQQTNAVPKLLLD